MQKQNYKGKCIKQRFYKHEGACRLYQDIQEAYANILDNDETVKEFRCNVPIEVQNEKYTSDFMIIYQNGEIAIRECVKRNLLPKPKTAKSLDSSRLYWMKHGISNWGLIINAEK